MTIINPYYDCINHDFKIEYLDTNTSKPFDFHFHDNYEIYLCLTDDMSYMVNNRLYNLNSGDLMIFNSSDIHKSLPPYNRDYKRTLVLFNPEFIRLMSTNQTNLLEYFEPHTVDFNHRIHLNEKELKTFTSLLKESSKLTNIDCYASDIEGMILLSQILIFINKLYRHNHPHLANNTTEVAIAVQLLLYLHTHYHQTIDLDHLAHTFGFNKNLLNREFKKMTGHTIIQYLINYRIFMAKFFLKQGESVSETAVKSGFSNLSHFIRTFHDKVGTSPKQYTCNTTLYP